MNKYTFFASEIKEILSFKQVAELYGVSFNRAGFAVCPFHAEKTASFKIKDRFGHCFGCGWSGDVISFVMKLFDLRFVAAIEKMNNDFGLELKIGERLTLREKLDCSRKVRAIELERLKKKQLAQERLTYMNTLLDEYAKLDIDRIKYAPKNPNEQVDERWINAINRIEYISYLIDSVS